MADEPPTRPVSPSRLSKTPSWISLGFVLGALFVLLLPSPKPPAGPPPAPPQVVKLERPKITEIEAVFATWGERAVWKNDLTEIALWDTERHSYSLYFEVLRNGDVMYFRSIPHLTRPILTRGADPQAPLQFTETEETRREWLEHGQFEPRTR
jgi:hypothetical protein